MRLAVRLGVVLAFGVLVGPGVARGQDEPVIFHAPPQRGSDASRQRVAGWGLDNAERALDLRERSEELAVQRVSALEDEEVRLLADLDELRARIVEAQERANRDQAIADEAARGARALSHARRCDSRCLACHAHLHARELQGIANASAGTVSELEARQGGLCVRLDEVRRAQAKAETKLRLAAGAREDAERRLERAERKLQRVTLSR